MTVLRSARRSALLATAAVLAVGVAAPAAASATAPGTAATLDGRGSDRVEDAEARTSAAPGIDIRDLDFSCPADRVPTSRFRDTAGSPFTRAIDCLVWYGVTEGRSPTSFEPNGDVTRRQMALFLHRLLDDALPPRTLPAYDGDSRFRDVPDTGIGSAEINVLASAEIEELLGTPIVTGRADGSYDPSGTVTRAQMGSFIARVVTGVADYYDARITRGSCTFPDQRDIPAVHADNVSLLCELGVVGGRNDGTYGPRADVTRGQMAAFLTRTLDVFAEARITVPPDERAELRVDAAATGCGSADGSTARPFCAIQDAVVAAGRRTGELVQILVAPGSYAGDVALSSGAAESVDLVATGQGRTPITGRVVVDGDGIALNLVAGFDVAGGVVSRSGGDLVIVDSRLAGPTALRIEQPADDNITAVFDSVVSGTDRGIDVVSSGAVPVVVGVRFSPGSTPPAAYVVLPAGVSDADGTILATFTDPASDNRFPAPPRRGQVDGRVALLPA